MHRLLISLGLLLCVCASVGAQAGPPLLLRSPTVSRDSIAFVFAGDLWVVGREGGDARRLTYHPGADITQGWTPDGRAVLFRTSRDSPNFTPRLFTMPLDGSNPAEVPLPQAAEGS